MTDTEQQATEVNERNTKAVVPAQDNGQQNQAQGLRAMTERDVNEYLSTLLESQQPPAGMAPIEIGAVNQYRTIAQQQGNAERRLTRTQNEVEALKAQISRFQGQSEAYVNLLVMAEDSRRAEAKDRAN